MSTNTLQTYLNRIPSANQQKPDFIASITAVVSVLVQIQTLLASIIDIFDLSLSPVGNQLDIIGEWVGISRYVNAPFVGTFFTWDDVASDGWDFAAWQPSGSPSELIALPDDIYLVLINATIAINSWDGTTEGIYNLWATIFPQYNLMIQDLMNMSYLVMIQGTVPDTITKGLITSGYLVPRPEGIQVASYVINVDTNPLFAWDCETAGLGGWDQASWGEWVAPT